MMCNCQIECVNMNHGLSLESWKYDNVDFLCDLCVIQDRFIFLKQTLGIALVIVNRVKTFLYVI